MNIENTSETQIKVLRDAIRRICQSAEQLEHFIRSGDGGQLTEACGHGLAAGARITRGFGVPGAGRRGSPGRIRLLGQPGARLQLREDLLDLEDANSSKIPSKRHNSG